MDSLDDIFSGNTSQPISLRENGNTKSDVEKLVDHFFSNVGKTDEELVEFAKKRMQEEKEEKEEFKEKIGLEKLKSEYPSIPAKHLTILKLFGEN